MVSRYHWLTAQTSGFLPGGTIQSLMFNDVTIPAGGILKKFILNRMKILGLQSGTTNQGMNTWVMQQNVTIVSGPNSPRILYESHRRIPATAVTISAVAINFYTGYFNAGDDELGVNQECSYGKATDTSPWNIRFNVALVGLTAAGMNSNFPSNTGEYTVQAKALYYK